MSKRPSDQRGPTGPKPGIKYKTPTGGPYRGMGHSRRFQRIFNGDGPQHVAHRKALQAGATKAMRRIPLPDGTFVEMEVTVYPPAHA